MLPDLYLASMNSTANAVVACQLSRLDEAALLSQLSSQLWINGRNPFRELLGLVSRNQTPTLGALHIVRGSMATLMATAGLSFLWHYCSTNERF
jgi:hypothetical protein